MLKSNRNNLVIPIYQSTHTTKKQSRTVSVRYISTFFEISMKDSPSKTGQQILEMMSGFRPSCVIGAAAELDLWDIIGDGSHSAEEIAHLMHSDLRATTMLRSEERRVG